METSVNSKAACVGKGIMVSLISFALYEISSPVSLG